MILKVYAFYDKKTQELSNPFFMQNEDVLKRELELVVNDKTRKEPFVLFPSDFDVYEVGIFDTNAVIKNLPNCKYLSSVVDYVKKNEEQK